jgi:galactonate dehydratase
MATCHTCAAVPNFLVLEWHALEERSVWDSYVKLPDGATSIVEDGHIRIPETPGIGVELDMDGVRRHAVAGYGIFE